MRKLIIDVLGIRPSVAAAWTVTAFVATIWAHHQGAAVNNGVAVLAMAAMLVTVAGLICARAASRGVDLCDECEHVVVDAVALVVVLAGDGTAARGLVCGNCDHVYKLAAPLHLV